MTYGGAEQKQRKTPFSSEITFVYFHCIYKINSHGK